MTEQGRKNKNKYVPLFIQNHVVKNLRIWENLLIMLGMTTV